MRLSYVVVGGQRPVPVVVVRAGILVRLFARRVELVPLAQPVVLVACCVYIDGGVAVVVGCQHHVQSLNQQVALAVFQRRHQRMTVTVFFSEHCLLAHTGLYVLIHMRIGEPHHQPVCPRFACDTRFRYDRLIVIIVVEAAHSHLLRLVEAARIEILYGSVHPVVVVRIVLESIDLIGETVLQGLSEVYVRLVRVERAVRIGGIGEPPARLFLCHDVDDPAQRVGTEPYGDDTFVHLNALGEAHRDVVKSERTPHTFLRNSVDEHLYMLAAETVDHQLHVRAHASALAQFHSWRGGERVAQVLCGVLHASRINGNGVVGRTLHPADTCRRDRHGIKFYNVGGEFEIEPLQSVAAHLYLPVRVFIAQCRYRDCIFTLRCRYGVVSVTVCPGTEWSALKVYGGKVYRSVI